MALPENARTLQPPDSQTSVQAKPLSVHRALSGFRLRRIDRVILIVALLLLHGTLSARLVLYPEESDVWLSLISVALVLSVPLVIGLLRTEFDPFEPIYLVSFAYFLYFVVAPASDFLAGRGYFFGVEVFPLLPRGCFYLVIGFVGLMTGYYSQFGRRVVLRMRPPTSPTEGSIAYGYVLGILGLACFSLWLAKSHLSWTRMVTLGQLGVSTEVVLEQESSFQNYLFTMVNLAAPAFMILHAFRKKREPLLYVAFLALVLVFTTIGFRYRIMIFVMAPALYHFLKNGRRPRLASLLLVGAVAAFLIGAIGNVRNQFRSGDRVREFDAGASVQGFTSDLGIYQPYLTVVEALPRDHDYFYGSSFAYLLIHPIPRSLFPNKPDAPVREIVRAAFGGESAVRSGVAYPNIAEYYANFGGVGVLGGMLIFGLLMRMLYEYLRRFPENGWAQIFFCIALPFLVQVVSRGYFVQSTQEFIFFLGPVFFGARYMGVHRRHPLPAVVRT